MKNQILLVKILVLIMGMSRFTFAQEVKTLESCFHAALKQSEVVADRQELILQAQENYNQAFGRILPQLQGDASYFRQDPAQNRSGYSFGDSQYVAKLSASQPIFQGFREFNAMRQARSVGKAREFDWQKAGIDLYRDMAATYYGILALERELNNVGVQIASYSDRIQDLRQRVRIGRSRESEILLVDTTRSRLRAEEEDLRGRIMAAREVFVFLTGFDRHSVLQDVLENLENVDSLEGYLAQVSNRPDIGGEQERVLAGQYAVRYEQGAHYPSVGASGNAYAVNTDTLDNLNQDSLWDFTVGMSIPIFSGGSIQAKVRERKSQARQAQLLLQRVQRSAEEEVRRLYQVFLSNRAQLKALEASAKVSKRNYDVQNKDYRLGLVNNLDVLVALSEYQNAVRDLDRFRYQAQINFVQLETAVAKQPQLAREKP